MPAKPARPKIIREKRAAAFNDVAALGRTLDPLPDHHVLSVAGDII